MLLANLAKSDYENRIGVILDKYINFFDDEKFITSRQCIQNVWKIAICNRLNCSRIITELKKTYFENIHLNTHGNLIKEDVIFSLSRISKYTNDNSILNKVNELIDNEIDPKLIKSLKKILTQ
jgi:arginine deiminase